jgi:hypothetical protein
MWIGIIILLIFGAVGWVSYRATPETRSRAECLRSTVPLRNELANVIGAVGALVLLLALAASSLVLTYMGGAILGLALLIGWSADRRERAAAVLKQRHGH